MKQFFALICLIFLAAISQPARGSLFVSSTFDNAVYRVDTATGATKVFAAARTIQPHEMATRDGSLYIANIGGDNVVRISPDGQRDVFYQFDNGIDNPESLAFDSKGTLYVGGTIDWPSKSIYAIATDGTGSVFASGLGTASSADHLGMDVDANDNIYVSNHYLTQEIWQVAPDGSTELIASNIGETPFAVAVGPDQSVYVSLALANQVLRLTQGSSGWTSEVFASLEQPLALLFDEEGRLYVGQVDRVSVIDTDGSISTVATGFDSVRGLAFWFGVPEPTSAALACIGLIGALSLRRRSA